MRLRGVLACPECRSILADGREIPELALPGCERARAVAAPTAVGRRARSGASVAPSR